MPQTTSPARSLPEGCLPQQRTADFRVNYDMIPMIIILSPACREWLDENAQIEPWQRLRDDLVAIEHGYAPMLVDAMVDAGLVAGD